MAGQLLNEILSLDIYRYLLILTRIGAALMVLPGFGGRVVNVRFRVLLAMAISLVMLPLVGNQYPPLPPRVSTLLLLIFGEVTVGFFLGMLAQVLMSAMNVAGTFIGFQIGLTNAFSFDTVAEQQSATLTAFLSNLALAVILATDLHHLMLRAVADSYATFPPGHPLPFDDFTETLAHMFSAAFAFAIKISAPLLAFGLIFYAGLGMLSRLSPQIQVFMVALPLQVIGGLGMIMVALPLMIIMFLRWFEEGLLPFVGGR